LGKDNEAWQKTKADVMRIIHLVFKDHDLIGVVKAAFLLVLRVFNIPPDLLTSIAKKAMAAWDVVSKKPLEFIKNTVRSIGQGFKLLGENLFTDLKEGLKCWLFGQVKDLKINPPASWSSPKDLFFFALEVLGLSVDHVWELLAKRFDKDKVLALRRRLGQARKVIDWINNAIDVTKSPKQNAEGIWAQAKDFGGTILTGIAEWIAGKVAQELAIMAAAAATGGLSEVLDVLRRVYKALLTAKRYAVQILNMISKGLDNVLDIAAGNVVKVGIEIHKLMKMGMPVMIGFLAVQVGLGGVGEEIRSIIGKLREKVDEGILWFIDKIKAGLDALVALVKSWVEKILHWWNKVIPLEGGGDSHTLKFRGQAASAQLMVFSDPKPVSEFVRDFLTIKGTEAQIQQANKLDDKIADVQRAIVAADEANDEAAKKKHIDKLDEHLEALSTILISLMQKGADEGSEERPLQIDYPKRRASQYEDIFVGPRTGEGVRVRQEALRAAFGKPAKAAKAEVLKHHPKLASNKNVEEWNSPVQRFSATSQESLDGETIGLSPEFASLAPGRVLVYAAHEGTGGGSKINNVFKPYGFVPSGKGGEGLDGDHVMERQIGGPDELRNLWPLDRSENRSSGALVKELKCIYKGKEMTIHEARTKRKKQALYLLIRTVRSN
jgi:hypothetical protein